MNASNKNKLFFKPCERAKRVLTPLIILLSFQLQSGLFGYQPIEFQIDEAELIIKGVLNGKHSKIENIVRYFKDKDHNIVDEYVGADNSIGSSSYTFENDRAAAVYAVKVQSKNSAFDNDTEYKLIIN